MSEQRTFVGLARSGKGKVTITILDETTILRFCHPLVKRELTETIRGEVKRLLEEKGLYLKSGTIV